MSDKLLNSYELEASPSHSRASSHRSRCRNHIQWKIPYYKMKHPRRGVVAIFNHESFENSGVSERTGSEKDVASLCNTFARLGFEVETYCDLTFNKIEIALEDLSKRDHSNCDCFVLVFMSHGLEGKLRSRDVVFSINCLWDCFVPHQAPTLAGKPKIFIVQACQGHGRQSGVKVDEEEAMCSSEDKVTLVPEYILPSAPDFLIALSTIPGFVSWRNPLKGSWYIQTLCKHLDQHGFEQDLVTLLTHVGREIAVEYSVIDTQDICQTYKKQLPSVISLLVKRIQFTRKQERSGGKSKTMERKSESSTSNENVSKRVKRKIEVDTQKTFKVPRV